MNFNKAFRSLTDNDPFPWQELLYQRFIGEQPGGIPASCNIPTGLGKTSVVAVWLLALAKRPELVSRRLVYVVNRRTVVDQTSEEVNRYNKEWLMANNIDLAISSMRGQYVDNQQWSGDPSRPAVICGTVDMIGSRLLFSGYGIGYKAKPLHAGFLGQDALIVHDESHLEPAFQVLLKSIESEQLSGRSKDSHPIRVMELTATSRSDGDCFELTPAEKKADFNNPNASKQLKTVWKRIHATKQLKLVEQKDSRVGEQLATLAIDMFKNSADAVLIFTRTIDDVKKIEDKLSKAKLDYALLIGPMRGRERENLFDNEAFKRFLPANKLSNDNAKHTSPNFLICTSAGEVGVNISADHIVCDLSTFESMAQRFGRVNRFGENDKSEIHVVYPTKFTEKTPDAQRQKTLALLHEIVNRHNANASPHSLSQLDLKARSEAFAPTPTILPSTDILFDAWSMTSIRERMPGRPIVEPYLHGIQDWEPPETTVAWREEVGVIVGELLMEYPPKDLLEEYPLQNHELLRDRTDRILVELEKLANHYPDKPLWIVDETGEVDVVSRLADLVPREKKDQQTLKSRLENNSIILPRDVGGLTKQGLLNGDYLGNIDASGQIEKFNNDVSDVRTESGNRIRMRIWRDGNEQYIEILSRYRSILQIKIPGDEENEDSLPRTWRWYELPIARENSKHAVHPLLWKSHTDDVVRRAREIVDNLNLPVEIKNAIVLAAEFHDLGKQRARWQQAIGRPKHLSDKWFAKSGREWVSNDRIKYRHEFGSLIDFENKSEFKSLDDASKDLVLHLVAAHHGQARPHFTSEQTIDSTATAMDRERIASEVPRRFARLQQVYGRWGLAYYESILRAADWHASAHPDPSGFDEGDAQ